MANKEIDVENFARRVEQLCDFLIAQYVENARRDGSEDLRILEEIKEEAADIQAGFTAVNIGVTGLDAYMKGLIKE